MAAAIIRCVLGLLVFASAAAFAAGSQAASSPPHGLDAAAGHPPAAIPHASLRATTPCNLHEVHTGHACPVCVEHAVVRPLNRTRDSTSLAPPREAGGHVFSNPVALAAQMAAARLVLTQRFMSQAEIVRRDIYARTARLRN